MVAASIMIDPVTFLLCHPKVATHFVYKDPKTWLELAMHFFFSRELFISNSLSRHFSWSHNIVFTEDLETKRDGSNFNRKIEVQKIKIIIYIYTHILIKFDFLLLVS